MDTKGIKAVHVFLLGMLLASMLAVELFPLHESHISAQIAATVCVLPSVGGAFTVREFCEAHRISIAFFYVMKNEGWGPREMRAGSRVLISHEAAAEWRRAREVAASAGTRRNPETAA